MEVKAQSKWVRMSPRKIRRVADLIRGKDAKEALLVLKYLPHAGARVMEKTVKTALANAKHNYKMGDSGLIIARVFVDGGPALKRWRARSKGRAFPVIKRTSHVTVFVSSGKGD